jgi:oligosaccharide repeat unit polymerase
VPVVFLLSATWLFGLSFFSQAIQIAWFMVLPITVIAVSGTSLIHPAPCFSFFFSLYSVFYPLHRYFGAGYTWDVQQSLFLHGVALLSFLGAIYLSGFAPPSGRSAPDNHHPWIAGRSGGRNHLTRSARVSISCCVIAPLMIATIPFVYQMSNAAGDSKSDLKELFSHPLVSAGYASFVPLTTLCVFVLALVWKKLAVRSVLIATILGWFTLAYAVSGERDIAFRFIFIVLLMLFSLSWRFKRSYYGIGLIVLMIALPYTQAFKAFLVTGGAESIFSFETIFVGEFISSARNLAALVKFEPDVKYFEPIIWDLGRIFELRDETGLGVVSTGRWFETVFRPEFGLDSESGWGFTFVGFWYLSLGILGISLGFFLVGLLVSVLYALSRRNEYWYVFYIIFLSVLIYAQRGDLATLVILAVKFTALPLFTVYALEELSRHVAGPKPLIRRPGYWARVGAS